MYSFYSKIRKKMADDNRPIKYLRYAIGEIILVVIGILIALQVNNLNEQRKEKKEELKILKILKTEYSYNRTELDRSIGKAERMKEHSDTLLKIFAGKMDKKDFNTIQHLMLRLGAYPTFDPSNGALNDLIGSGKLKVIRNDSLRFRLSQWSGMLQDVKEDEERLMGFGDQYIIPIELELFSLSPDSKFESEAGQLFNKKSIENTVYIINGRANYLLDPNYKMLKTEIDEILQQIDLELNKK
jgi:hypothetical protein